MYVSDPPVSHAVLAGPTRVCTQHDEAARRALEEADRAMVEKACRAAERMLRVDLSRGWSAWVELYEQGARRKRVDGLAMRALRRIVHRSLGFGWSAWVGAVEHARAVAAGARTVALYVE